jgi:branched-subunit amino acid aminotransferase/4-amino-4-deoxychorismate lyase
MEFLIHNGKIIPYTDFHADLKSRVNSLSLSQDMWFANGEIPHFNFHLQELNSLLIKLAHPSLQNLPPGDEILRLSKRLINKNKAFMGGWLRLSLSCKRNDLDYVISTKPCAERIFPLDQAGKTAIISPFVKYSGNLLSRYFFFSESLWKTEHFRSDNTENEVSFFLNEKGVLTEATGANLFCLSRNQLWTPAEETGCIIDIMREHVIRSAQVIGFSVNQSDSFLPSDIQEMEEIFLVSEGSGFKWIMGMGTKRFFKKGMELIWKQVNKSCFHRIS